MWIRQHHYLSLGLIALVAATPVSSQSPAAKQLPPPAAAAAQAEKLSPEELTQIEIDEVTRDRLRFDPAWQPMLEAIRQDLMAIKWGNGKLENPVWQQYGAKAYPLLEYYSRTGDETRQIYGIVGIRSLGKPYTTLWLKKRLQQRLSRPTFYYLTENPRTLLGGDYDPSYSAQWEQEFGLDNPQLRQEMIRLAQQNLEPPESPRYYDQFNLDFLVAMLGYEKVYARQPSPYDPKPAPNLSEWSKFEKLNQLSRKDIEAAIAYYRNLSPEAQEYLLVERLGKTKVGKISAIGRELLQSLAKGQVEKDRIWAIAELDRHGDSQASQTLAQILNNDLSQLHSLTRSASHEDYTNRGTHAYYLLVNLAQKYPNSRFVQGCREYGDLVGKSYFGGEPRSQAILDRNAKKTPAQRTQEWQQWLNRYPNHPGADDATYHLARSLQDQNQSVEAMQRWLNMMTQPMGDRDALYLAWGHVRTLLDVGLTIDQLQALLKEPENAAIAPLLQYTLAVRYARMQDYGKALQTSEALDLTQMPTNVLGSYYGSNLWSWWFRNNQPATIQQQMQTTLQTQRQRWQQLQGWQQENTPESRYKMASNWAGQGGWQNGYLPIWDEGRITLLPTGGWWNYYCQIYGSCNTKLKSADAIRDLYQQSSQNAVALSLYQSVLADSRTSAQLRETTLYMTAQTLLHQWENYPWGETLRIHPPAGVRTAKQPLNENFDRDYRAWEVTEKRIQRDYQTRIDGILTELQVKFPKSTYIDDLLFSSYFLSGQPSYLQQLVERYPQSDRAAEAKFLLENRRDHRS
jgi:hypothetical protein